MYLLCVAGELIVYQQVKKLLKGGGQPSRTISLSVTAVRRAREENIVSTTEEHATLENQDPLRLNLQHITSHNISELELEAAHTLAAGIISLALVVGPFIIFTFTLFMCRVF